MKYEKIYKYLPYFKEASLSLSSIDDIINDEFINLINENYLIEDYDNLIGEFCYDNEGWYDIGGIHDCLEEMTIDELIAILSSICIQDQYFKGLFLSEIKSGFIYKIIERIKKLDK